MSQFFNDVTFTPIAKNFMLYCRLIYMLPILCVRRTIKVKVGIPESFKGGWYPLKKTGSSHLKEPALSKCKQLFDEQVARTKHDNKFSTAKDPVFNSTRV